MKEHKKKTKTNVKEEMWQRNEKGRNLNDDEMKEEN